MNQVLIITGGSKGIGYATGLHFAHKNWQVINISRNSASLENSININLDLAESNFEHQLREKLKPILQQKTTICLVHNAAYHLNDTVMNQKPSQLLKALNVSIVSPSIINQILIPFMQEGSSIIYIGSTLSEKAVPNAASYTTIKHATVGLMRATCQDLAKKKIHTACICPGFTNTAMLQQHLGHDLNLINLAKQKVSFERFIEPNEIAELIYFSAINPMINGSVIHANLGQLET
ncbi:SDR family oxidoreductase [Legionella sp. D16C41]|uniref:SDR family oxidoreductase n=1 Tax=Legionella sp. D16C41 TaxID=3402688 RepID=UPI003AF57675